MLLKYLLFVVVFTNFANSAKILGIFWTPSRSHHIAGVPLLHALAKKGHQVDFYGSFNDKVDIPTYKQELLTTMKSADVKTNASIFGKIAHFYDERKESAVDFFKNEAILRLIKTRPKYDVIISLAFFSDYILALGHHLNAPIILFSSSASHAIINKFVANPNLPYGKHVFSEKSVETFAGRLSFATLNMLMTTAEKYFLNVFQEEVKNKYLPNTPHIWELQKNTSLVLVNSHFSLEQPKPYVPNMIPIGGFYNTEIKKLPGELQKFLDSATDGAVLFSMGTNVKIGLQFADKIQILMNVFRKMKPIKVLFKSEMALPSAPENVHVLEWLPQNDVLAHPNVKIFISHGGLGGVTEAVFHGVPMLGIPFFADQGMIGFVVRSGFGLRLDRDDITEETLEKSLVELLKNPKYAKNAKKRSSLFRNQPIKPMDHAIWWVEHIIEHKGGEHLKNIGVHLEWYQLYMVDIVLFYLLLIVIVITTSFCTTKWVIKKIYNKLFGCTKKNANKIKKQ